jgi:hypothetical protein
LRLGVCFRENFAAGFDRKAVTVGVNASAAEHSPNLDGAKRLKQSLAVVRVQAGA